MLKNELNNVNTIGAAGAGALEVAALEYHDGWPALAKTPPPKPPGLMAFGMSDKTAVLVRGRMAW